MKIEKTSVEYVMHMGDDLNVVDNARVSFGKESEWAHRCGSCDYVGVADSDICPVCGTDNTGWLNDHFLKSSDEGLIRFLALGFQKSEWKQMIADVRTMSDLEIHKLFLRLRRHATHWAPFAHPHIQVRVTAPIFLARQLVKHQIGLVWSEVSRRYVDSEPSFWMPEGGWRARPEGSVKQGSSDLTVASVRQQVYDASCGNTTDELVPTDSAVSRMTAANLDLYFRMLAAGIAPELSRVVLPQNMMVTWRWTGSLMAFSRVAQQRLDGHAQKEAQILGRQLEAVIQPLFPASWDALVGDCMGALE